MIHNVGDVDGVFLIHHVVVLVNMQNVHRDRDSSCIDKFRPVPHRVRVTVREDIYGPIRPCEQLRQFPDWIADKVEVVQINVENRCHLVFSLRSNDLGQQWL